jgi:uncharacterized protein YaiE (UPF0345 family)
VLRIFIVLKKSVAWAGFEPVTLGSSGRHTNHYTTEATVGWYYHAYFIFRTSIPEYSEVVLGVMQFLQQALA